MLPEPTTLSSGSTLKDCISTSGTPQVSTAQEALGNDQPESMAALELSAPDTDHTPANGESDRASRDVTYTINYDKQEGVSRHMKQMSEQEFKEVKEFAAKWAFEVKKDVQVFEKNSIDSNDQDRVQYVLGERILIYSPRLLKAVREVITYWPTMEFFNSTSNKRLELRSPYRSLGAYREEFKKYVADMQEDVDKLVESGSQDPVIDVYKVTISEVNQLMKEANKRNDSLIKEEEARHRRDDPKATFDMLWLLFRPGQLVYAKISGVEIACRVTMLSWQGNEIQVDDPTSSVIVYLWYLDFNGKFEAKEVGTMSVY